MKPVEKPGTAPKGNAFGLDKDEFHPGVINGKGNGGPDGKADKPDKLGKPDKPGGGKKLPPEIPEGQTFAVDENSGDFTTSNVVVASDPNGDAINCTIVAGNEAGIFALDPTTGELSVVAPGLLDFESGVTSYTLTIQVTDDSKKALTSTADITVTVNDVNEAPTAIAMDGEWVMENTAGAVVGNLTVDDPDAGNTHSFTVSDARFEVVTGQLKLLDGVSVDFEAEPSITVDVTATDSGGLSVTQSFVIAVKDVNEAPTAIALDNLTLDENAAGAVIGNLTVTDPDAGDTHSYAVSDSRFEVVNGQLKLLDGVSLDFEIESSVTLQVTATDSGGLAVSESFTLTVANANDQPVADPVVALTDEDAGTFSHNLLGGNVSDQDIGDLLSITSVTQILGPGGRDLGGAFSVTNGVLSFDTNLFNDLTANDSETIVFEYVVDDGSGAANSSATNTLTVVVQGRDDAASGGDGTPMMPSISVGDLDGTDGLALNGGASGDMSGHSVSSAGDVNGDGFDDMLVSAIGADPNGVNSAGSSYVVFGQAGGWAADINLSALDGTDGFRIDGAAAFSRSGYSVSSAGDVNGDGFADVIVSATHDNGNTGASYVVFGKADWSATASFDVTSLDGTNGFRLDGVASADNTGSSVSSAGDVNGDGYDDLVIGANFADPNGNGSAGSTYVVFGQADWGTTPTFDLSTLDGTDGFRLDGAAIGDTSGGSVASAGDVNGDGYDDIVIGAERADPNGISSAGSVYVVFGQAGGWAATTDLATLDGTNGFRLDGASFSDSAGNAVASAGDVNGDGYDDLIIGAYGVNGSSGASYVVFGQAGGWAATTNLSTLNGSNGFRLVGGSAFEMSGYSVSSAGDFNGDGFDDLLIGARYASHTSPYSYSGSAYVVYGKAAGWTSTVDLTTLDGTNGFRIDGVTDFGYAGTSVSSAGDINGDGFDDIMVGASGDGTAGAYGSGSTYVLFGGDFSASVTQLGTAGADSLTGTTLADSLFGAQGADVLIGNGGADLLNGGEGDDVILVSDLGFQAVDGGNGSDTLGLSGAGLTLDLSLLGGRIDGIEAIDLTGTGNNSLAVSANDLLQLSDTSNSLFVQGDAGDQVDISSAWLNSGTTSVDGVLYNVYTVDGINATLNLDVDLTVQVV